jgi:hypothetical protein
MSRTVHVEVGSYHVGILTHILKYGDSVPRKKQPLYIFKKQEISFTYFSSFDPKIKIKTEKL